jgi:hypothetical protein
MRITVNQLRGRLEKVENHLTDMLPRVEKIEAGQISIADDTKSILAAVDNAKGVIGFVKRHASKILFAAAGAGMFNPTAAKFVLAVLGN